MKHILKQVFTLLILMAISGSSLASVMFVDGYVRAMPPSVPNSAAYFTLMNHGPSIKLIGVDAAFANDAQLHTVLEENGMVKMRQVSSFEVAENATLTLSDSGQHVMLLGLKQPLVTGSMVALILKFDDGSQLPVSLMVSKQGVTKMSNHEHQHN